MGYTTDFEGSFQLDEMLTVSQTQTLINFNEERHEDYKFPGIWCQWVPSADGCGIEWDGGEKFYEYTAWLVYVIENYIKPWGRTLNGSVEWQGEDNGDRGLLVVKDNVVSTKAGRVVYG